MLDFKFNPTNTQKKNPGEFTDICELWNITYTHSKKGLPMVKYTWKYGDCLFDDYHSCYNDEKKEQEAQYLGQLYWLLKEDPQQVIDGLKPNNLDELVGSLCTVMNQQLRFKATVKRYKRTGTEFYNSEIILDKGLERITVDE